MSLEDFLLRYESVRERPLEQVLERLGLEDSAEVQDAFEHCPERVRPYLLFGFSQEQFVPVRPAGPRKLHSRSLEVKKAEPEPLPEEPPKNAKAGVNKVFSAQLQSNSLFQQRVLIRDDLEKQQSAPGLLSQSRGKLAAGSTPTQAHAIPPIRQPLHASHAREPKKLQQISALGPKPQTGVPRREDPRFAKWFEKIAEGKKPVFVLPTVRMENPGMKIPADFFSHPEDPADS